MMMTGKAGTGAISNSSFKGEDFMREGRNHKGRWVSALAASIAEGYFSGATVLMKHQDGQIRISQLAWSLLHQSLLLLFKVAYRYN